MKPVDQIIMSNPAEGILGDSLRACVASLLEVPLKEVPLFGGIHGQDNQFLDLGHWLYLRQMSYVYTKVNTASVGLAKSPGGIFEVPVYHIALGSTSRGSLRHAVVAYGPASRLAHDPHPSRKGLKKIKDLLFLVPLNPVR